MPTISANEKLVLDAMGALFSRRDFGELDRYVDEGYVEHEPGAAPGREGLHDLIRALGPWCTYEPDRVEEHGDLVLLEGRLTGCAAEPRVSTDLFRVADGRIVEHWAAAEESREPDA